MAVFTPVTLEDLTPWISEFPLGKPLAIRGISSGIENSNFFVDTETGEYVLTLFEKLRFEQLPFYLNLMRHLAERGVLVPAPIARRDGEILTMLCGKPACLVTKLEGDWLPYPKPIHCGAVGAMMASMHLAGRDYPLKQPNLRALEWWIETAPKVMPYLDAANRDLLDAEMRFQQDFHASETYANLPRGPVHADLFRNNVMFDGDKLTGFFDFYFAGCDTWLFDLAVAVNDWCIDLDSGVLDNERVRALLDSYSKVIPFTEDDRTAWQPMLRAAALRFWLSRLYDFHMPRAAEMLTPHDPRHFERILRLRKNATVPALTR